MAAWQGRIVAVGPADAVARAVRLDSHATVIDAPGAHRGAGVRRFAHARRVRRRSPRRAGAASGRGQLCGNCRGGRRHRAHGRGDARGDRGGTGGSRAPPAGRDARPGHDQLRDQERLRPRHRRRAADAARHSRAGRVAAHRGVGRRSWARTRCQPEYRGRRGDYLRLRHRRHAPGRGAPRAWPSGTTSSASTASSRPRNRCAMLEAGKALGLKPRIHADELGGRAAARLLPPQVGRGRRPITSSSRRRGAAPPPWRRPASSRRCCRRPPSS